MSAEILAEEQLIILLARMQRSDRRSECRSAIRHSAEQGVLEMTLAENVATLPQPRSDNYEFARFNALRHGVLSKHAVLPWEDGEEYSTLLEALVVEHKPQGPTEEHLVEELAGVIWRKRRLRLGENAAHHRALMRATDPYQQTAKAALIDVGDVEGDAVEDAIRAGEEQSREDREDLEDAPAHRQSASR